MGLEPLTHEEEEENNGDHEKTDEESGDEFEVPRPGELMLQLQANLQQ